MQFAIGIVITVVFMHGAVSPDKLKRKRTHSQTDTGGSNYSHILSQTESNGLNTRTSSQTDTLTPNSTDDLLEVFNKHYIYTDDLYQYEPINTSLSLWTTEDIINKTGEFYNKLCGNRCIAEGADVLYQPLCPSCSCDEDCNLYGDCCEMQLVNPAVSQEGLKYKCIMTLFNMTFSGPPVFMKHKCSHDFNNATVMDLCNVQPNCQSLPVTSLSGTTYLNQYCAICNEDNKYAPWKLELSPNLQSVSINNGIKGIFECLYKPIITQPLYYTASWNNNRPCDTQSTNEPINTCSTTETSKLELLCRSFSKPVFHRNLLFQNIFCYLCNGYRIVMSQTDTRMLQVTRVIYITVKETKRTRIETIYRDNSSFILDPFKNKSMEIHCSVGLELKEATCVSKPEQYQIVFTVVLDTQGSTVDYKDDRLIESIKSKILKTGHKIFAGVIGEVDDYRMYVAIFFVFNNTELDHLPEIHSTINTDWIIGEQIMSPSLLNNWTYSDMTNDNTATFVVSDEIIIGCCQERRLLLKDNKFIEYTEQFLCAHVLYYVEDFDIGPDNSLTLTNTRLTLFDEEYTSINKRIKVCVDTLKNKVVRVEIEKSKYFIQIFTLVFSFLSLICLGLAFITYCTFPSIRTLPSKNNMALIACLFCAHLLIVIVDMCVVKDLLCKIFGILIHYSWLCVIFWMNVCSFHMFSVFRSSNITSTAPRNHTKRFLKYALYGSGMPLIIVSIVMITSVSTSGSLGYGGLVCYLSSGLLVGIAFVFPLTVIIVSNISFLTFTIRSISKTSSIARQTGKDRHHMIVYIKLSTITGLFWAVDILSVNLDWVPLLVLSIILNYGQGIFIFLSYMVNKRVLNLWLGLFGKPIFETSLSSTSSKKTFSTNSQQV